MKRRQVIALTLLCASALLVLADQAASQGMGRSTSPAYSDYYDSLKTNGLCLHLPPVGQASLQARL
jgi:hypothetical protein